MTAASLTRLPYELDATRLFEQLLQMPWAQLLDSCGCDHPRSRYDILVADPLYRFISSDDQTLVYDRDERVIDRSKDAFALLDSYLQKNPVENVDLPFCGGIVGYFGYDLLNSAKDTRPKLQNLPEMAAGFYEWAIVIDHQKLRTYFVTINPAISATDVLKPAAQPADTSTISIDTLQGDLDPEHYRQAFARIQHYLIEGDCYQVNYARCFHASYRGSAWHSYLQLRQSNPVPFAAYLDLPFARIISCSPERFIRVTGRQVESCPIKGTRPRHSHFREDQEQKRSLRQSEKDRAENLMIVDLLRNDLGKSCVAGSIRVPELFGVETFPTVFHMVSTITGTMREEVSPLQVLQNSFPGGSITGAPKKRAMEIIAELETWQRELYCGAIGYISLNGKMDTNIAIRTMVLDDDKLVFWAGGGIVADSQADQEFAETNDKARAFLSLLKA
jgi:para-aminobenzoate synthetase component 1